MTEQNKPGEERQFHIVGIGASAGGLDPLETFFKNMPTNSGMGFVVVQHLSPDFKSQMEQLLSRKTRMPIHRVEDGIKIEPDNIYLIPPKKMMAVVNGRLLLTDKAPAGQVSHPIDEFFRSLAVDAGRRSIGIILSGTGADGSKGVISIAEAGGLVLAQDEETARTMGINFTAISSGSVARHCGTRPGPALYATAMYSMRPYFASWSFMYAVPSSMLSAGSLRSVVVVTDDVLATYFLAIVCAVGRISCISP